jgi:hypothetical protein
MKEERKESRREEEGERRGSRVTLASFLLPQIVPPKH